ncbi:MAG: carbohydrate-binding domain-containing protein [Lachnospiraceae bacterium]|nr:carbohydrate-binding domain-containing protein [Lachnospiraceae bacterium]
MKKSKWKIYLLCLMVGVANVSFAGCSKSGTDKNSTNTKTQSNSAGSTSDVTEEDVKANAELVIEPEYSAEELSSDYDENNAVMISLEQNQISCDSQKISVSGSVITILKSGTYVLQGELEDGSIVVDIDDDDIVRLVFAGVDITSKSSAPVYVKEAKETIITLKENTINTISDAAEYVLENEEDNEPNAAIFSKDDLAINGSGTLKIQANYNHGIQGKDDVVLISGKIEINSVGDAIVGKDSVVIKESDITIESEASGIKGTNTEGGKGYVYLDNPTIAITSKDDGIHADVKVLLNGGTLTIEDSYEGLEACILRINDGDITIHSSDDGINATNGSSEDMMGGMTGGNMQMPGGNQGNMQMPNGDNQGNAQMPDGSQGFGQEDDSDDTTTEALQVLDVVLEVNGGTVYVEADGDGIDSNGSVMINGGCVYIDGPTNGGNGALDYATECQVNGGVLVAAGSLGMEMAADSNSQVPCVNIAFENTYDGGTEITIQKESGEEVISYTPSKSFSSFVLSHDGLEKGSNYVIYANGTEVESFTVSDTITSVGNTSQMGMGADMGRGGQR